MSKRPDIDTFGTPAEVNARLSAALADTEVKLANALAAGEEMAEENARLVAETASANDRAAACTIREERLADELARLADDALLALSGAGAGTPAEGYARAPWCLKGDIERLAKERDTLRAELAAARPGVEAANTLWMLRDCDQSDQAELRRLYNAWNNLGAALNAAAQAPEGE